MENDTKCEKCNGPMGKVDENTMKCGKCGVVKSVNEKNEEVKKDAEAK